MKRQVCCCDVCGAEDRPDNRVCVRVSGLESTPEVTVGLDLAKPSYYSWSDIFGTPAAQDAPVDLCKECAGGLLALLRTATARRAAAKRAVEKVRLTPSPIAEIFFNDVKIADIEPPK